MSQSSSNESNQRYTSGTSPETPPLQVLQASSHFEAGPLSVKWLEKSCNWPPLANTVIEDFAKRFNFYNLRKSDPAYEERLTDLKHQLRELFDHSQWVPSKHEPMLQSKIEHKIHRLRKANSAETGKSKLDLFRDAFNNLDAVDHEPATKFVHHAVGSSRLREWMGDGPRFVNMVDVELDLQFMQPMHY